MIGASSVVAALISGCVAGCVAIATTMLIEKLGGMLGGILGSTPSTIIPASIGILSQVTSRDEFIGAMFMIAVGMLINTGFLFVWLKLPQYLPTSWSNSTKLISVLISSLLCWLGAATCCLLLVNSLKSVGVSVIAVGVTAATVQLVFGSLSVCLRPVPAPKGHNKVPKKILVCRGLLAGVVVFSAVLLSKTSGVLAGLAATFPAIFLTTMVSIWYSQGQAVTQGAAGPMMLGGLSVDGYSMTYAFIAPVFGTALGCMASYVLAVGCVSVPVFFALRKRQQDSAKHQALENQQCGEDEGHKDVPLESVEDGKNQLKQRLLEDQQEENGESDQQDNTG